MDGLYWETWYNGWNVSKEEQGYIFYENKLLGLPRMRQLKVRNDSCTVHDDFKNEILECFSSYATSVEDMDTFGPGLTGHNSSAYVMFPSFDVYLIVTFIFTFHISMVSFLGMLTYS